MEKHETTKDDTENSTPQQKKKKIYKTHIHKSSKKNNHHNHKYHSNKNTNVMSNHRFFKLEKISLERESSKSNLRTINKKYKKELISKIAKFFLDKKKFKISNNFDAKNSKKFLDKKNKCLERIILSDKIENNKNQEINMDSKNKKNKKKFETQKNMHKYFIVITNYDEEKSRNSQIINNNISTVNNC